MKTFYAHRPHVAGTTRFAVGDARKVEDENEVKHLVALGVLGDKPPTRPTADAEKAAAEKAAAEKAAAEKAAAESGKAEGAADSNKAEGAAEKNK